MFISLTSELDTHLTPYNSSVVTVTYIFECSITYADNGRY